MAEVPRVAAEAEEAAAAVTESSIAKEEGETSLVFFENFLKKAKEASFFIGFLRPRASALGSGGKRGPRPSAVGGASEGLGPRQWGEQASSFFVCKSPSLLILFSLSFSLSLFLSPALQSISLTLTGLRTALVYPSLNL